MQYITALHKFDSKGGEAEEVLIRGGLLDPISSVSSFLFSHFEIHRPICRERETSGRGEERLNDFINCIFYRPGSYNVSLHDELAMQRQ